MNAFSPVYLDYAATTPVDRRVVDAMLPFFTDGFGNPSSIHYFGQKAEAALEIARESIADCFHCDPEEVLFTSGGTESDNLALRGIAIAEREKRGANHILTTPVEHHAVLHTVRQLARYDGFDVELLPVDSNGLVDPDEVDRRIRKNTALVSVIFANNEIGSIQSIGEIGQVSREHGTLFHTDAVQAAAHLLIDVNAAHIDLMSVGAHKFYGPKGVGALYIRKGIQIIPTQTGGAQETGRRAGTQNIPYIVGMAEALRLVQEERSSRAAALIPLRNQIISRVQAEIPQTRLTGHPTDRLPNHASFVIEGVDGNTLLMMLDSAGFACSSGSACKTGSPEPSEVLLALGLSPSWALGSLRVTLGQYTTSGDVDRFLAVLPSLVEQTRVLSTGMERG